MPAIHIDKSIEIAADREKVKEVLTDFTQWRPWSPWLITEPEAVMTISDDGESYTWQGDRTGQGSMKKHEVASEGKLTYKLAFLKPWKSKADITFLLEEKDGKTKVNWIMDSSLPFFMFFMKKKMECFIGMDYERGLRMLKDYLELGTVPSKLSVDGIHPFPGLTYAGLKTTSHLENMIDDMPRNFKKLMDWQEAKKPECVEGDMISPFSQYLAWDMTKGTTTYTCGVPVANEKVELTEDLHTGKLPKLKVYVITHTGPYHHLGNAWSTGMGMSRAKVFKTSKAVKPFELYINDPNETDAKDLIAKVCFPVVE